MRIRVWGASTLRGFTDCISLAFQAQSAYSMEEKDFDFALIQLHGAPQATEEDAEILEATSQIKVPKIYLIHRPDEILLQLRVSSYFESHPEAQIIFLGDLVLSLPFWQKRISKIQVIPHPFMDVSMPKETDKAVVGSFTSWGEMRKLEHFLQLTEMLKSSDRFCFKVGGSGIDAQSLPPHVELSKEFFVPHFNVQLYHLNERKRLGESSGSLHRGVSVPVIFEANGMERLENINVVKVLADDDLKRIDFKGAASQIIKVHEECLKPWLESNRQSACKNSPGGFALSVLKAFIKNDY